MSDEEKKAQLSNNLGLFDQTSLVVVRWGARQYEILTVGELAGIVDGIADISSTLVRNLGGYDVIFDGPSL